MMFAVSCTEVNDAASVASIRCMINVLNQNTQSVCAFLGLNGLTWLISVLESDGSTVKMFYAVRLFYMLICQRFII
jgi:hypothetical protein